MDGSSEKFVIKNKHLFYTNNQIHSIHTKFKTNLHPPTANLTKFQTGVYYSAIKIFNNLWGHSQLVSHINPFTALFRAQYNTCTSLQNGPFQGLQSCPFKGLDQWFQPITRQFILTNHRSVF
jgi:hypothetical protein